jgi:hypothetical protein
MFKDVIVASFKVLSQHLLETVTNLRISTEQKNETGTFECSPHHEFVTLFCCHIGLLKMEFFIVNGPSFTRINIKMAYTQCGYVFFWFYIVFC